ncbi:hypothetical protein COT78_02035 [Candidatus Berkelbacteria bacterium CG10_big_fil_rev_8_21_14_0_10_43_13]|uniref:Permease n=1 Tax=Candidatus Berkelbacteria bacterium CG10_big_fil_rev_8_21_14_0_10_43_13 TaxID=1974514 RepID=A0A2H0W8N4_9BACT|nr:MAG: hypothetical protein COT78_02035 [Candidatus Berkelbacteria bacterium CG10_big_fil_rev_8_21_14_0_10_43_13]
MNSLFQPVQLFADWLTYTVFGLDHQTLVADGANFFIYDTIKIFIMLLVIIFVVAIIRSFLPQEKIRKILSHKHQFVGNILAALFGVIAPFCTCSAIPLFLGFIEAGVPLGVTFSFLVASPMVNEIALVLLWGLFGWKVAILYMTSGLLIAIFSGIIIGRLNVENLVESYALTSKKNLKNDADQSWRGRSHRAWSYSVGVLKDIWLYVVVGIGIGALIHGLIPADALAKYAGSSQWYSVPIAVLIGIPLYAKEAAVIPLVSVLTEKGVSMGTTLAFMMSTTGLSLPEFMILKKVMKTKLIVIFASIVGLGILFTGYLFNFVLR